MDIDCSNIISLVIDLDCRRICTQDYYIDYCTTIQKDVSLISPSTGTYKSMTILTLISWVPELDS